MSKKSFDNHAYPLQKETYLLNGIAIEIHRILGRGFLEIVYKDALELELRKNEIPFTRERNTELNTRRQSFHINFMQTL